MVSITPTVSEATDKGHSDKGHYILENMVYSPFRDGHGFL